MHLGYRDSILAFAAPMLLVLAAWRGGRLASVPAFWTAYVLTRPLGASIADWIGKPSSGTGDGVGLGVGDLTVAGAAVVVLAGTLVWLSRTGHDAPR